MIFFVYGIIVAGLAVSVYAHIVERQLIQNPAYTPVCDIRPDISCSKALRSGRGKLFGIPHPIVGAGFFLLVGFFIISGQFGFALALSLAGVIASVYLARELFIVEKNFCVVCTTAYVITLLLFLGLLFLVG